MSFEVKIPLDDLKKLSLFVATPCYGGMTSMTYMRSMADLAALTSSQGIKLSMYMLSNESLIPRARNYCADEFMRSECTHFCFIDADICFNPYDIIAAMAAMTEESSYDVFGAPYPKKCISWEKIVAAVNKGFADENPNNLDKYVGDYVFNPVPGTVSFSLFDPVEVLEIGTGFMLIKRKALEKFRDAFPERMYRPDHVRSEHFDGSREIMMYFQAAIDRFDPSKLYETTLKKIQAMDDLAAVKKLIGEILQEAETTAAKFSKRYLSEDYEFCQRCRDIGLHVWLAPWMRTQHYGSFNFAGSLQDLATIGQNPTADAGQLAQYRNKKKA